MLEHFIVTGILPKDGLTIAATLNSLSKEGWQLHSASSATRSGVHLSDQEMFYTATLVRAAPTAPKPTGIRST